VNSRTLSGMLVLLLVLAAPTVSPAGPDSHRQAVARLFELTHLQRLIEDSVDDVIALQIAQTPALAGHRDALHAFLEKYIGWQALKDDLAAMYLQAFTEAELDQMNAFYSSPTGQKVLQRLPELVRQRNQLAMQRLQQHIGELQQEITGTAPGN
jgi:uncharacterized protein